jgi:hypothetical protein
VRTLTDLDSKDFLIQVPTGPLRNKNVLASHMSINIEPFQRTDISTQPLGPAPKLLTKVMHEIKKSLKLKRVGPLYMQGPNPTEPAKYRGSYTTIRNSRYRNRNASKHWNNNNRYHYHGSKNSSYNCNTTNVSAPESDGLSRTRRRFEYLTMPIRLDTVLRKVEQMSNSVNSDLLKDFYQHMKDNGTSQNYQKGTLKAMIHFSEHIGATTSFYDVDNKQVVRFLDTKTKPEQIDPDKKWVTTWNDYLWRLKLFFRWLHNKKIKEINGEGEAKAEDEWKTPPFLQQIKKKKTKRLSPYLETEVWDRDASKIVFSIETPEAKHYEPDRALCYRQLTKFFLHIIAKTNLLLEKHINIK